jgi:hypothetical protein
MVDPKSQAGYGEKGVILDIPAGRESWGPESRSRTVESGCVARARVPGCTAHPSICCPKRTTTRSLP